METISLEARCASRFRVRPSVVKIWLRVKVWIRLKMNRSQWKSSSRPSESAKNTSSCISLQLIPLGVIKPQFDSDILKQIWWNIWKCGNLNCRTDSFLIPCSRTFKLSQFLNALSLCPGFTFSPQYFSRFMRNFHTGYCSIFKLFSSTLMHIALLLSHREFVVFCPSARAPPWRAARRKNTATSTAIRRD